MVFINLETFIDIVLVGVSLVILFLGCRGMLKSGVRNRVTYMYLTGVGLVIGFIEILDAFELLPQDLFLRETIGESEIFVLLLVIVAMWQYRRATEKI